MKKCLSTCLLWLLLVMPGLVAQSLDDEADRPARAQTENPGSDKKEGRLEVGEPDAASEGDTPPRNRAQVKQLGERVAEERMAFREEMRAPALHAGHDGAAGSRRTCDIPAREL